MEGGEGMKRDQGKGVSFLHLPTFVAEDNYYEKVRKLGLVKKIQWVSEACPCHFKTEVSFI